MVTVPNVVAFSDHLSSNPVFMHTSDRFQKPTPFAPDVIVGIDGVVDQKVGTLAEVPTKPAARLAWLDQRMRRRFAAEADAYRDLLIDRYGPERGRQVACAEGAQFFAPRVRARFIATLQPAADFRHAVREAADPAGTCVPPYNWRDGSAVLCDRPWV